MPRSGRTPWTLRTPRAPWLAGVLTLAALLSLGGPMDRAQAQELHGSCTTENLQGEVRDCSATERFSRCAINALDAKAQCYDDNEDNWFLRRACDAFFVVDMATCFKDEVIFVPN